MHYLRDLHELDNDGRIAFFLNIYNTLSLHMLILYHAQMRDLSSLGMLTRWQRKVSYIIGGSVMSGSSAGVKSPFIKDLGGELSLYEIEFSILRSGLSAMRTNEPEAQCSHEFSASDPRYPLRVVAPNLINFAICWNTSSSPTIRVYTRENLMNELRTNTSSFCRARCRLYTHSPPKKVRSIGCITSTTTTTTTTIECTCLSLPTETHLCICAGRAATTIRLVLLGLWRHHRGARHLPQVLPTA